MDGWYARASGWCRWLELLARCTVLPEKCQRARHLMFLRACGGCRRLPCLRPRVVPTTLVYLCLHVFLLLVVCSSLDFYTILGVPRNAEKAAIKKAYHKLALDLHPDKNDFTPGSAEAEEAVRKYLNPPAHVFESVLLWLWVGASVPPRSVALVFTVIYGTVTYR